MQCAFVCNLTLCNCTELLLANEQITGVLDLYKEFPMSRAILWSKMTQTRKPLKTDENVDII